MAEKTVLGKGLASLLPGVKSEVFTIQNTDESSASTRPPGLPPTGATAAGPAETLIGRDRHPGITFLDVSQIVPNPHQPRRDFSEKDLEELAASVKSNGIIQPLVVRRTDKGYELIAGERRLRAAKKAGLKQVPVVVRRVTDRESLELAIIENIQREDLNCVDEALAYFQLMEEFGLTQEKIAEQVGKERSSVANHLRLLKLPQTILDDLKRGALTFGHGKVLASIEDPQLRIRAHQEIIQNQLSVREAESLVLELKSHLEQRTTQKDHESVSSEFDPLVSRLKNLSQELTRSWGAKVRIQGTDRKGKIQIQYGSREELDRLIAAMQNEALWQNRQT
jgi:ParB family chromosome partitioning protein